MSTEPAPEDDRPAGTCCGQGGPSWSPKRGADRVQACRLCPDPNNDWYWDPTGKKKAALREM